MQGVIFRATRMKTAGTRTFSINEWRFTSFHVTGFALFSRCYKGKQLFSVYNYKEDIHNLVYLRTPSYQRVSLQRQGLIYFLLCDITFFLCASIRGRLFFITASQGRHRLHQLLIREYVLHSGRPGRYDTCPAIGRRR